MSRTKDFVRLVLSAVAEETDIPCESIISRCSRAEVVDARWLAVVTLHRAGLYPARIAEALRITPRYVQYIITDFPDRTICNPALRNNCEKIANKLGIKHEMPAKQLLSKALARR